MDIIHRPRRLRSSEIIRNLSAETVPHKNKLIMPHFVMGGKNVREEISSMPGIERVSIDNLLKNLEADLKLGMKTIILFGIPDKKDCDATEACSDDGIIQDTIRIIKKNLPEIFCITDLCLCEYTDHGHCGVVDQNGNILNDESLEILANAALVQAKAGADMIAPSDMMDGRVGAIRAVLDNNGYTNLPILSYSAKYSSAFYGPFREAAGSAPQFGDRKTYQMDCRNAREALKEVFLDIDEGADIIMVKPALSYLDIIRRVKEEVLLPVCAYNVSGEYSMVKLMGQHGYGDEERLTIEILTSIFRAGSDMIISYHTRDVFKNNLF